MALSTKGMFDIKVWDDIRERCGNEDLAVVINNRIQLFYPINTEEAIKKLTQVGNLYQLAYAGSKCDGACSVHVIEVLSRYQDLVKSTVVTCTTLTNVVLKALSFHKPALIYAEKEKPNKAIGFLRKCGSFAGDMAVESDKMIIDIGTMIGSSIKALKMVKENFTGTDTDKQAIIECDTNLTAYFESSILKANDLKERVEKAKIEEANTKDTVKKNMKARLIFGLLGPISYIGSNADISSNELKLLLQNEARNVNDDLADSIQKLKQINYPDSQLYTSVATLEVAIKILEKIKTMFLNAKEFWIGVKHRCDGITSSETASELKDDDVFEVCKNAFVNEIKTSGLGWLAIGKICREASLNIRAVSHGVDRTNTRLFEKKECEKEIQELCSVLLSDLLEENEKIEDVKSDWLYEVLVKGTPPTSVPLEAEQPVDKPFNYLVNGTDGEVDGADGEVDGADGKEDLEDDGN